MIFFSGNLIVGLLTGGGGGQKRPPDGGLFDLSGERLTGWRSREQLKTHPQKNAADYGKSIREIVEWFDQQF